MTKIIDGKKLAKDIKSEIKAQAAELKDRYGVAPGLSVLLVGDDPASNVYARSKERDARELGFNSEVVRLPAGATEREVLEFVRSRNENPDVHGILVQLPLPKQIDERKVVLAIDPDKDVDGFHPVNLGKLMLGYEGFAPCTPAGILEALKRYEIETAGKRAVILGRSNIVGKPLANMLLQKSGGNAIVTVCHTAAEDFSEFTRQADILVAAMGVPEIIKAEHIKEGAVVVDVGINRVDDSTKEKGYRLCGDVDFDSVNGKAGYITPVPGGVGLLTRTSLMKNTLAAAEKAMQKVR